MRHRVTISAEDITPRAIRRSWDMAVGGAELANGLSGAHSQAMGIVFKIAELLAAICVASIIALTLGFVAHYVFCFSRLDIRTAALIGAGIIRADPRPASGDRVARMTAKIQMTRVS